MEDNFMKVKDFADAANYLDSFVNYEKKNTYPYQKVLKLKRVKTLLKKLNIPYHKLRVIHIAGTKGKGSTATFCAYILAASGYRIGLYTSPHFFDFRERIAIKSPVTSHQSPEERIKSVLIAKKDVVRIAKEFKPHLEKLRFSSKLGALSFFEVYTAIAFRYFLEKKVDFVVLETGLGGRLDATNVVTPLVAIITHIGYDHMDKLGKHICQIASEKAGIIKKNIPTVLSLQRNSAACVIKRKCKKNNSELFILGKDFRTQKEFFGSTYTTFDFSSKIINLDGLMIKLKGRHQVENASLAIMAVSLLKSRGIFDRKIKFRQALRRAYSAGRFEIISKNPLLILDVAHNPLAFNALAETLKLYFPKRKIILIFAASRDKDIKTMLKKLSFLKIILTTFNNPRAFAPEEIKNICRLKDAFIAKDIKEALSLAKELYQKNSLILVSGSLFLVSEAKKALQASSSRSQDTGYKTQD
jgi:dihydrofolate synthase/folylpolyglutamate synthase